jgi:hypothetical protein
VLALPAAATARRARPAPIVCPDDLAAALAAQCPCDLAETHGQYVRCVARFRNLLRRGGCLGDDDRGMVRCAARSTCGRPSAVLCCMPAEANVRVRVTRDETRCAAVGGTTGGTGTACGACLGTTTSSSTSSTSSTSSSSTSSTSTSTSTTVAVAGVYGNAVEYPGASVHAPDYLAGDPLMVSGTAMLTHLCVIAKAGGPNVVLALYGSNAMGEPEHLMAAAPATPLGVGPVEIPVTPTMLPAGQYWMFGVYDAEASIGLDESDPAAPVRYVSHAFGSPPPEPFGPAASYPGQRFNYYLRVQ